MIIEIQAGGITVDRCLLIWCFFALILHEAFRLVGYVLVESGERFVKIHTAKEEHRARLEREFNIGVETGQRNVLP